MPAPLYPLARRGKKAKPSRLRSAVRTLSNDQVALMTEPEAHSLLCRLRWPETDGRPVCPQCGCLRSGVIATRRLFRCPDCRHQFSVTSGTIWHGRKLPLRRILMVVFEFVTSPKGISAAAITMKMDFDYKTSWILNHKIREAIASYQRKLVLSGVVEIDGVYFGRRWRRPNLGRGTPPAYGVRTKAHNVLTLAQRDGPVAAMVVEGETKAAILSAIRAYVSEGSQVITDELSAYDFVSIYFQLKRINHSIQFANGSTSINNAESFHARMRRSQRGVYHRFANGKDFDLYVQELAFRHSHRETDTRSLWEKVLGLTLRHPKSNRFRGYRQGRN